MKKSAVFVRLW